LKLVWSPQARADLRDAILYVAQDNPYAAKLLRERIKEAIEKLPEQPHRGRPGRVPHTRELVIAGTPYTVPYQVQRDRLEILRVFHQSRTWPESFTD
jgi:toxin ParE1/3/4